MITKETIMEEYLPKIKLLEEQIDELESNSICMSMCANIAEWHSIRFRELYKINSIQTGIIYLYKEMFTKIGDILDGSNERCL